MKKLNRVNKYLTLRAILLIVALFVAQGVCADPREACGVVDMLARARPAQTDGALVSHLNELCSEYGNKDGSNTNMAPARVNCTCRNNNPPGGCEVDDPFDCKKCITGACDRCCKAWYNIDTQGWIACMQSCCGGDYTKEERPPGSGNYVGVCSKRIVIGDPVEAK